MDDDAPRGTALASRIRRRRTALGLDQVDVAALAGCSPRFLSKLESGTAVLRLDKVLDVLDVLGLTIEVRSHNEGMAAR